MTETQLQTRHLGYARVSTYGQTHDAQLAQLKAQGCSKIYREKASGAQPDRRELLKLLKAIAPGDVVIVTRIDRLARSTFDLFAIMKQIVDAGGQFRSWADHRHQLRTADDRCPGRTGGCGTRPDQDPHGGGARPGEGPRAADGPAAEAHAPAASRGSPSPGRGRDPFRTGQEL